MPGYVDVSLLFFRHDNPTTMDGPNPFQTSVYGKRGPQLTDINDKPR